MPLAAAISYTDSRAVHKDRPWSPNRGSRDTFVSGRVTLLPRSLFFNQREDNLQSNATWENKLKAGPSPRLAEFDFSQSMGSGPERRRRLQEP
jgi:hypothetical protein